MKTKLSLFAWVVSAMLALAADQPVDLTATDVEAFKTNLGKSVMLRGRLEMGELVLSTGNQRFILVGAADVRFYVIPDSEPYGSDNHYRARWNSFAHKQVRVTGELKFHQALKLTGQAPGDYFYMVLQRTGVVGMDYTGAPAESVPPALARDETIAGAKARAKSIATWQPWTKPVRDEHELVEALRARWPIERIKVFCTAENDYHSISARGMPVFPEPPNSGGLLYPENRGEWIPFYCSEYVNGELKSYVLCVRNGSKDWCLESGNAKYLLGHPPRFWPAGF